MLEKIDKIQELLNVPNIDASTETAIANMRILNLLVDLRAEAEQLILSGVVSSLPTKEEIDLEARQYACINIEPIQINLREKRAFERGAEFIKTHIKNQK